MIGPRVRIVVGVLAAVLAVVLLLEDRGDPVPADPLPGVHDPAAPSSLAPGAAVRRVPAPGDAPALSSVSVAEPPADRPTARQAEAGIRGRIDFGGALPPGLTLRVVPATRDREGRLLSPIDVAIAPDGTFLVPLPESIVTLFHVAWDGGSVEVRREPTGDGAVAFAIRLGTCRLEGRILDTDGRPVPGIHVRDDAPGPGFELAAVRVAVTDAGGAWALDHLPAGNHTIESPRPPPTPTAGRGNQRWVGLKLSAGEHRTLDLGYSQADATWTGRLRPRSGGPLRGGGRIALRAGSSHTVTSYDEEGRFVMRATPGAYQVVFEPSGPRRKFVLEMPLELRPATTPPQSRDSIVLESDVEADVVLVGGAVSGRVSGIDPKAMEQGELDMAFRATARGSTAPLANADPIQERLDRMGSVGRFTAQALPPGRYVVAGFRLGGIVDLVDLDDQPVVVDVVDGGEITELELTVKGP